MSKKHVLFVQEKFCDLNPLLGFTNGFHNIFNTFSASRPDYSFNTIHLDEAELVYNKHIDDILFEYYEKWSPEIIIFSLLGGCSCNPSLDTYKKLKELGVKTCIIWPDTGPGWGLQNINEIGDLANLHVSWDCPEGPYHNQPKRDNHIFLWTPEDDRLYFKQDDKDIDISLMGSLDKYRDRIYFAEILKNNFPNIVISGGQRTGKLSPESYASIIRRSKIGINFAMSQTGVFYQLKGRVFEYIASGGFLLESENPVTRKFFTPNKDYVEFNENDLLQKIDFYLKNPVERVKIAENGYKVFNEKWTAKHYWDELISRLLAS